MILFKNWISNFEVFKFAIEFPKFQNTPKGQPLGAKLKPVAKAS
jgi:hypothetical protein